MAVTTLAGWLMRPQGQPARKPYQRLEMCSWLHVWDSLVTTHGYWTCYKYGTNSRTLDSLSLVAMTKVIKNFNQASYRGSLCNYQATEAMTEASLTGTLLPQRPGSGVFPSEGSRWLSYSCQQDHGLQI